MALPSLTFRPDSDETPDDPITVRLFDFRKGAPDRNVIVEELMSFGIGVKPVGPGRGRRVSADVVVTGEDFATVDAAQDALQAYRSVTGQLEILQHGRDKTYPKATLLDAPITEEKPTYAFLTLEFIVNGA